MSWQIWLEVIMIDTVFHVLHFYIKGEVKTFLSLPGMQHNYHDHFVSVKMKMFS